MLESVNTVWTARRVHVPFTAGCSGKRLTNVMSAPPLSSRCHCGELFPRSSQHETKRQGRHHVFLSILIDLFIQHRDCSVHRDLLPARSSLFRRKGNASSRSPNLGRRSLMLPSNGKRVFGDEEVKDKTRRKREGDVTRDVVRPSCF